MQKRVRKKRECFVLIVNLILAVVAFSVLVGLESEMVGAVITNPEKAANTFWNKGWEMGENVIYDGQSATVWGNRPAPGLKFGDDTILQATEIDFSKFPASPTATTKPSKFYEYLYGTPSSLVNKAGNPLSAGAQVGVGFLQGAVWAGTAYGLIGWIAPMLGASEEATSALQAAGAAAFGTAGVLRGFATTAGKEGFFHTITSGAGPWVTGLVVGVIVFLLTYKKTTYKTYSFECQPWEAPIGGEDCEKCNDENHVCSEYRCKSLGQACELANDEDTGKPLCYWANPEDVNSPAIQPWEDVITEGYRYSTLSPRPPGGGFEVVRVGGESRCIEPFTAIEFGIETDKPSQCRIGYNLTTGYGDVKNPPPGYDEMDYYFGGSNLYDYFHLQKMKLPGPDSIRDYALSQLNESESPDLEMSDLTIYNGGYYNLYVRCRSPNGYYNADPYLIRFCVEEGPDLTPPIIEEFSIDDRSPVQYGVDNLTIVAYTNEPANCRWSRTDQVYGEMENEMNCANEIWQMQQNLNYACTADLTNVEDRKNNDYYFRCEDQPWNPEDERNRMSSSETLTLIGTQPLNIKEDSVSPENGSTVAGSTSTIEVNVELETENGYKQGESTCYYAFSNEDLDNGRAIEFEATESYQHSQRLYLITGAYHLFIKCIDAGGNEARTDTLFTAYYDQFAPNVVRAFYNANQLEIYTDEDAECYFSTNENTKCNYVIGEETFATLMSNPRSADRKKHLSDWDTEKTYYIKCQDVNGRQPNPTECSVIVKPVEI